MSSYASLQCNCYTLIKLLSSYRHDKVIPNNRLQLQSGGKGLECKQDKNASGDIHSKISAFCPCRYLSLRSLLSARVQIFFNLHTILAIFLTGKESGHSWTFNNIQLKVSALTDLKTKQNSQIAIICCHCKRLAIENR